MQLVRRKIKQISLIICGCMTLGSVLVMQGCSDDDGPTDNTPPVITLLGSAIINIAAASTFVDPGATASDDLDGDISAAIVINGDEVDTNTLGAYVITYDVSDDAGNAAVQLSRTVVVGLTGNGNFENGDSSGWLFFDQSNTPNGGTVSLIDSDSNGEGTYSVSITSGTGNNPGIKQERFGVGIVTANQNIEVTIDYKAITLADGAIINVLAFTEGVVSVTTHILESAFVPSLGNWGTKTYSFTTGPDATGGISLLVEVVCGGGASCEGQVLFDNIFTTIE